MTTIEAGHWLPYPGRVPAERDVHLVRTGATWRPDPGDGGDGRLVLPAPVNAHDHGYGIRTLDFGSVDDALEAWVPTMRQRPRTDPYLEALVAFGRIAAGGVGATMHLHNSLNVDRLVDEAGMVVRAAGDVGVRLGLSCPLLDTDPWAYGGAGQLEHLMSPTDWADLAPLVPRYAPISEQIAAVEAVMAAHQGGLVDVQYGPVGPQWCSDRLLETIAERSQATGRRVHMHLLESPRQRAWLDRRFPQGVVRFLDEIGLLSPRLAVAHGVQLRPDECALLAERGVIVVSNPTANLRLRSGVAPVSDFRAVGLKFAIGLDGTGLDDDQDLWREMRLLWQLHAGRGLVRDLSAEDLFDAAIRTGAAVIGQPAAEDLVVVDFAAMTEDAIFDDVDAAEILLARMCRRHARDLFVSGREVMRDGRLVGIDFDAAQAELRAQARADRPRLVNERRRAVVIADAVRCFYASWV